MENKLKDLAADHDYYASESNYYSRDASQQFDTFAEFYQEYHDADIDMNLVYRWDIKKFDHQEAYYMEIFIIRQRKGIYAPIRISRVLEEDVENVIKFLTPHLDKLRSLWEPLNSLTPPQL